MPVDVRLYIGNNKPVLILEQFRCQVNFLIDFDKVLMFWPLSEIRVKYFEIKI